MQRMQMHEAADDRKRGVVAVGVTLIRRAHQNISVPMGSARSSWGQDQSATIVSDATGAPDAMSSLF
jgi:hypothetical protein